MTELKPLLKSYPMSFELSILIPCLLTSYTSGDIRVLVTERCLFW